MSYEAQLSRAPVQPALQSLRLLAPNSSLSACSQVLAALQENLTAADTCLLARSQQARVRPSQAATLPSLAMQRVREEPAEAAQPLQDAAPPSAASVAAQGRPTPTRLGGCQPHGEVAQALPAAEEGSVTLALRRCRICFESDTVGDGAEPLVRLQCLCRGELSLIHASCANTWFKRRGACCRAAPCARPRGPTRFAVVP